MKANYEKPVVKLSEEQAEGVYMASGDASACYTAEAKIHQRPQTGRGDYRIQVNGTHKADHNCNGQILTLEFNQAVTYVSSGGQYQSGDGTPTLKIKYSYWQNHTDNIGAGDVVVQAEEGLSITGASISDADYIC